ncbi:rab-GTPase-TBC domain-containing protein [Blastocladiella britannica]|nr:rab-GTPase-TBC domain-containing protein [Blastocladiella britannica]
MPFIPPTALGATAASASGWRDLAASPFFVVQERVSHAQAPANLSAVLPPTDAAASGDAWPPEPTVIHWDARRTSATHRGSTASLSPPPPHTVRLEDSHFDEDSDDRHYRGSDKAAIMEDDLDAVFARFAPPPLTPILASAIAGATHRILTKPRSQQCPRAVVAVARTRTDILRDWLVVELTLFPRARVLADSDPADPTSQNGNGFGALAAGRFDAAVLDMVTAVLTETASRALASKKAVLDPPTLSTQRPQSPVQPNEQQHQHQRSRRQSKSNARSTPWTTLNHHLTGIERSSTLKLIYHADHHACSASISSTCIATSESFSPSAALVSLHHLVLVFLDGTFAIVPLYTFAGLSMDVMSGSPLPDSAKPPIAALVHITSDADPFSTPGSPSPLPFKQSRLTLAFTTVVAAETLHRVLVHLVAHALTNLAATTETRATDRHVRMAAGGGDLGGGTAATSGSTVNLVASLAGGHTKDQHASLAHAGPIPLYHGADDVIGWHRAAELSRDLGIKIDAKDIAASTTSVRVCGVAPPAKSKRTPSDSPQQQPPSMDDPNSPHSSISAAAKEVVIPAFPSTANPVVMDAHLVLTSTHLLLYQSAHASPAAFIFRLALPFAELATVIKVPLSSPQPLPTSPVNPFGFIAAALWGGGDSTEAASYALMVRSRAGRSWRIEVVGTRADSDQVYDAIIARLRRVTLLPPSPILGQTKSDTSSRAPLAGPKHGDDRAHDDTFARAPYPSPLSGVSDFSIQHIDAHASLSSLAAPASALPLRIPLDWMFAATDSRRRRRDRRALELWRPFVAAAWTSAPFIERGGGAWIAAIAGGLACHGQAAATAAAQVLQEALAGGASSSDSAAMVEGVSFDELVFSPGASMDSLSIGLSDTRVAASRPISDVNWTAASVFGIPAVLRPAAWAHFAQTWEHTANASDADVVPSRRGSSAATSASTLSSLDMMGPSLLYPSPVPPFGSLPPESGSISHAAPVDPFSLCDVTSLPESDGATGGWCFSRVSSQVGPKSSTLAAPTPRVPLSSAWSFGSPKSGGYIAPLRLAVQYSQYVSQGPPLAWAEEIEKDISRTMPEHIGFVSGGPGQCALRRVLHAFAHRNPHIGYAQAMNLIGATLLRSVSEPMAFACLCWLAEVVFPGYFVPTLVGAVTDQHVFEFALLPQALPRLARRLQDVLTVGLAAVTVSWFLALFQSVAPPACGPAILDGIMADRDRFMFLLALGFMLEMEPDLMAAPDELAVLTIVREFYGRLDEASALVGSPTSPTHSSSETQADGTTEGTSLLEEPLPPPPPPSPPRLSGLALLQRIVLQAYSRFGSLVTPSLLATMRDQARIAVVRKLAHDHATSATRTLASAGGLSEPTARRVVAATSWAAVVLADRPPGGIATSMPPYALAFVVARGLGWPTVPADTLPTLAAPAAGHATPLTSLTRHGDGHHAAAKVSWSSVVAGFIARTSPTPIADMAAAAAVVGALGGAPSSACIRVFFDMHDNDGDGVLTATEASVFMYHLAYLVGGGDREYLDAVNVVSTPVATMTAATSGVTRCLVDLSAALWPGRDPRTLAGGELRANELMLAVAVVPSVVGQMRLYS